MWSSNSAGAVIGVPLGLWLADRMGWRASATMPEVVRRMVAAELDPTLVTA